MIELLTLAAAALAAVSSTVVAGAVGFTILQDRRQRQLMKRAAADNAQPIRPSRRERRARRRR